MNMKKETNEDSFTLDETKKALEQESVSKPWNPKVLSEIKLRLNLRKERKISKKHDEELIEAIEQIRDEIEKKSVDDIINE